VHACSADAGSVGTAGASQEGGCGAGTVHRVAAPRALVYQGCYAEADY